MTTTITTRTLASGTLVEVDERGRMVGFATCGWQEMGYPTYAPPAAVEDAADYADAYAAACEDGPSVQECQARVRVTHGGWGFACEAGHSHVAPEARAQEGWDYAADQGEAEAMAKVGTTPFTMNGAGVFPGVLV